MSNLSPDIAARPVNQHKPAVAVRTRIESIDLLRGTVMIIMALDHVRDYFYRDTFLHDPTDLTHTSIPLFFTRWITHFCAPVFIFLAGVSACLYGIRKGRKELAFFLLTRGVWLLFAELFLVGLGWSFNPTYPYFNLQVIWAIGCSMIALSALIYLPLQIIGIIGLLLIAGHNLLDNVHFPGNSPASIAWGLIHDGGYFHLGHTLLFIHYPILPWIGVMAVGYCVGYLYRPRANAGNRISILFCLGAGAITLFIILRALNGYGDPARWSVQPNAAYSLLSFLNVTKYPPSLLYVLMTLGPAMIFLALSESVRNTFTARIQIFGRVPMFYYLAHIYLIHLLAVVGVGISIHNWKIMFFIPSRLSLVSSLKGYGFGLLTTYLVWISVVLLLYPLCKRFDQYKRKHQSTKWWLSYF
ncbi:MAG TPA: heparan-alpha-glucosaminide N-acetyltransferase domain-containing protein [Puia sp.]